jgi:2-polyprenyl-3-methyl-5-hydroxy-6-metoxy-1,4-benzoquinol methylase
MAVKVQGGLMKIPDEVIKYILFQRTGTQRIPNFFLIKFLRKLTRWPSYNQLVEFEAKVRKGSIKKLYEREIQQDFNEIRNYLPVHASNILDVGCGIGGIDVLLFKHYQSNKDIVFCLLDKTEITTQIYYWFKQTAAFYNSLKVAENFCLPMV